MVHCSSIKEEKRRMTFEEINIHEMYLSSRGKGRQNKVFTVTMRVYK